MADVQKDSGYFTIANRLGEAILAAPFNGAQLRIILALFRVTYGWRRRTVKCTETELARWSGMAPGPDARRAGGTFRQALKTLVKEGVVMRIEGTRGSPESTLAIQKDYEKWGEFSVAEARLTSTWGEKPAADDATLRAHLASKNDADEMAREQAMSRDEYASEDGPQSGHVTENNMARPQATSKTTWPISGPTDGLEIGHGSSSKSLNGETYESGKTGKTDIVPTTLKTPLSATSIFSESADEKPLAAAAEHYASETGERPQRHGAPEPPSGPADNAGDGGEETAPEPPRPAPPSRARSDEESERVRQYAIAMSTSANKGIEYRWGEQPNPVTYVTGIELAEELLDAGVPVEIARTTIVSICHASKLARPPKTLRYFRDAILDANRDAEQRAFNAADPGTKSERGGEPRPLSATLGDANRDRLERERLELEHGKALTAAAIAWGKDPKNRAAYQAIVERVAAKYAEFPSDAQWVAKARAGDIIAECAKAAEFPDFATWRAGRDAKAGAA